MGKKTFEEFQQFSDLEEMVNVLGNVRKKLPKLIRGAYEKYFDRNNTFDGLLRT